MKIAIDTSPFYGPSKNRGIGIYTANLIDALKKLRGVEIKEIKRGEFYSDVDIIHYPYFDFFFLTLPLIKKRKTVVTVHDCTPLIFPRHYPPGLRGKIKFLIQKFSLEGVAAVITDSQSSKNDIIHYLGVPDEKIHVIYLAADPIFRKINEEKLKAEIKQKYDLPEEFVFYVGDVNYNKNLPGLVEAFGLIKDRKIKLVLAGGSFEKRELPEVAGLLKLIKELNLSERVKILGYVPADELSGIYNLATLYCQPSFYEGFGLQILEAMACGCPVITSNVSSLPEVAGEAAILVDPENVSDVATAINTVRKDKQIRTKMIESGFEQAKKFSWKKTAEKTIDVYRRVLRESRRSEHQEKRAE